MGSFYLIGLIFIAVVSLIFSVLGFMGKDMILDDAYIKASKEEREKMNKTAYRLQGGDYFPFPVCYHTMQHFTGGAAYSIVYLCCIRNRGYCNYLCNNFSL